MKNKFTHILMQTRLSPKSEGAYYPVSYFIVDMPVLFFFFRHIGVTFIMKKPRFRCPKPNSMRAFGSRFFGKKRLSIIMFFYIRKMMMPIVEPFEEY